MRQHTRTIDHLLEEPESDLIAQQSLERIVYFLIRFRYFFLVAGATFLAWELFEAFSENKAPSIKAILEVAMVSIIGPALMWFGSKSAEGFAKQVTQSQNRLVAANQVARREITELQEAAAKINTLSGMLPISALRARKYATIRAIGVRSRSTSRHTPKPNSATAFALIAY